MRSTQTRSLSSSWIYAEGELAPREGPRRIGFTLLAEPNQRGKVYLNAPPPRFADLAEAEHYIRTTLAPFGALTDDHWRHLAEHSVRPDGNGGLMRHHDPGIAEAYRPWRLGSILMWDLWDKVRCPVLLLRGAESDLLSASTAREMTRRGPGAELIEFAGIGHLPALMTEDQIEPISGFFGAA